MSIAKKAVDSTLKRILIYTGEIIASIILLIVICLPLVFSVPMWIQRVLFDTPVSELVVNPLAWFGSAGFVLVIAGLAVISMIIGYPFVMKMIPGKSPEPEAKIDEDEEEPDIDEEEAEVEEEEVESSEEEEIAEDDYSDSTVEN